MSASRHPAFDQSSVDFCNKAIYAAGMSQNPEPEHDAELDATGLLCPLPVLKARKRLKALTDGQVLKVLADDPAAVVDVPHFCAEQGHDLMRSDLQADPLVFWIAKRS